MSDRTYESPVGEALLSVEELQAADRQTKIAVMRHWFFSKFEHPANRTPYDTGEGGYQWIWGGPYDAHEELETEFGEVVPRDVIEELRAEIEDESTEWGPVESPEDYDNLIIADIAGLSEHLKRFADGIKIIEDLLRLEVPLGAERRQLRMLLYANVITAIETYLCDVFIQRVLSDAETLRKFTETTQEFQKEKVPLSAVLREANQMEGRAREYLAKVSWHNLARVRALYEATLGIKFPEDTGDIYHAILVRHDIIHRNGKTRDGDDLLMAEEDVPKIIELAKDFVEKIDGQQRDVTSPF